MYQSIPMYWNDASQYWSYVQPTWQANANYWVDSNVQMGNLTRWNPYAQSAYTWDLYGWKANQLANYGYMSANDVRNIVSIQDYGANPFVIDIDDATEQNNTFRTALWTGKHLQLTLMSIPIGGEIGLERHSDTDQFLRIEDGRGIVQMGEEQNQLDFQREVSEDDVIIVPAGYWHNLRNTGNEPLKLYSIYAPPEHPHGTVHQTKADAEKAESD